jgi:hypothetical protein
MEKDWVEKAPGEKRWHALEVIDDEKRGQKVALGYGIRLRSGMR